MAAIVTLYTQTNADFSAPFQYQDGGGNPISIAGWTLSLMVRAAAADPRLYVSVTSATPTGGVALTDAVNGKFKLTLPRASLGAMPPGTYVHDLIGLKTDGTRETMWSGTVVHATGVTS